MGIGNPTDLRPPPAITPYHIKLRMFQFTVDGWPGVWGLLVQGRPGPYSLYRGSDPLAAILLCLGGNNLTEDTEMAYSVMVWLVNPGHQAHEEEETQRATVGRRNAPGAAIGGPHLTLV
jgi:hypothetical protein